MGLDGVELVMSVEEEFGVAFTDGEAAEMVTFGDMVDQVWERVGDSEGACLSARGFCKVRRILMQDFGIDRASVAVDKPIQAYFPSQKPHQFWPKLICLLGHEPTHVPLERPSVMVAGIVGASMVLTYWVFITMTRHYPMSGMLLTLFVIVALFYLFCFVLFFLTRRCCTQIPKRFRITHDLIRLVGSSGNSYRSKVQVESKLRELVCEQLAISPDEVTLAAKFMEDLGLE